MGREKKENCTKENFKINDLSRPCAWAMREFEYYKLFDKRKDEYNRKNNLKARTYSKYAMLNMDEIAIQNDSPVEITIPSQKKVPQLVIPWTKMFTPKTNLSSIFYFRVS